MRFQVRFQFALTSGPRVNLDQMILTVDYKVSLRWHDRRLVFTDLSNRTDLNRLTPLQNQLIWKPRLVYLNALGAADEDDFAEGSTLALIKQKQEDSFERDSSFPLTLSREARLFSGSENSLELSKKLTQNYPCQFDLFYYPFDTQVLELKKNSCFWEIRHF